MKLGGTILVVLFMALYAVGGTLIATSCSSAPLPPTTQPTTQLASQPAAAPALTTPSPVTQSPAVLSSKQSGNLLVSLFSSPNPPIRGYNTLVAVVTDLQGKPLSDAKLTFDLDMTNMSHGKNIVTASSLGSGQYSGQVVFMMPGPWRAIVRVERPGQIESIRFDFNVNYK